MSVQHHHGLSSLSLVLVAAGALAFSATAASCGDDSETADPVPPDAPTGDVEITVAFPDEALQSVVASVHMWVLATGVDSEATCAALIGGTFEPYDLGAPVVADVASLDVAAKLTAQGLPLGASLVYVEGVDHHGAAELAGCAPLEIVEPLAAATVQLGKARTFDCGDPATAEGAPCDDGRLCTVGEICESGSCGGARARSCTHVADACNAESCDEELGCVTTALSDGTPCQDGLFCTSGDVCQAGTCLGAPLDCGATAEVCQVAITCDEAAQQCVYDVAPSGTPCDDARFCTTDDFCQQGTCGGAPRDCDAEAEACLVATGCDDDLEACVFSDAPNGISCDDGLFCTDDDACSSGACEGGPRDCSFLDEACEVGTCDEDASSCVAEPRPGGTVCNDNMFCTTGDTCDGAGICDGAPLVCPGGTTCAPTVCDELANACEPEPVGAGISCNDGDVCTTTDVCNGSGTCAGVVIPDCP